jgi:MoaA/NifB/PqqE/SkfB family radical SAM enzyme
MLDLSIKEIHIEPTSLCNAECPHCARNINGKGINPNIKLKSLDLAWIQNNIKTEILQNLNKIFFCGTVGDPAATPELLDIIKYLKKENPKLTIGLNTNGGLKTTDWWNQIGLLLNGPLDYCVFSIDGLKDTNHIYRVNINWDKVMENAQSFISTGASAHWEMLVFDHNKHQVSEIKELARSMGFKWFRTKETDRWDVYKKTDILKPASEQVPIDYNSGKPTCERDRDRSIFLDHTGKWWPCCHIGEAYFKFVGGEKHKDIRQYSNTELFNLYSERLCDSPFYVCKRSCGPKGKRSQWKNEEQLA